MGHPPQRRPARQCLPRRRPPRLSTTQQLRRPDDGAIASSAINKFDNKMAKLHRRFFLLIGAASAFTNCPRPPLVPRPLAAAGKHARPRRPFTRACVQTKLENGEYSDAHLDDILSRLREHPSTIPALTQAQLRSLFDAVERATAESDENTVNKRALAETSQAGVEPSADRARTQMTALYRSLREGGRLRAFGAVGRPPPAPAAAATTFGGPIYPAAGSKIILPELLVSCMNC